MMSMVRGVVTLIGSGELAGTMVETHKMLLSQNRSGEKALFLDTPAGFQGNVDLIAQRAVKFFEHQVRHRMEIASSPSRAGFLQARLSSVLTSIRFVFLIFLLARLLWKVSAR